MKRKMILLLGIMVLALGLVGTPASWGNSLTEDNVTFNLTGGGGTLTLQITNALNSVYDGVGEDRGWQDINFIDAYSLKSIGVTTLALTTINGIPSDWSGNGLELNNIGNGSVPCDGGGSGAAEPEPPDRESLLDCVHCGICLPVCPTYRVLRQAMDSPRGRLYLMRAVSEGRIDLTPNFVLHMDRCLGCRACETACPSGVPFGRLLEEVRGQIERRVERPRSRRLLGYVLLGLLPRPDRVARLLALGRLYQRSGLQSAVRATGLLRGFPRLAAIERLLPPVGAPRSEPLPAELQPEGPARGTVALLTGCVQRAMFPEVNRLSALLLARAGYRVVIPGGQGCCGALHFHWGDRAGGRAIARPNLRAFEGVDWVAVNAAGCGATLREYGHLFPDEPAATALAARVRDVTELLAAAIPGPLRPLALTVTYHEPCHLAHGQRVREAPRALLRAIPGLTLVELPESDLCCGSAGVYNLLEPAIAATLLERKLDRIVETGARTVVSGNPGCLLQLQAGAAARGLRLETIHPVELVARAVEGIGRPA
jgi:glycolate oxidase iron-sulfur subunit